jgi:murein DD-endopeptidase MepM/ murein hydrolase activator NlpD
MFKYIGYIFLTIFVVALGYDLVNTAAGAMRSGSLMPLFPMTTAAVGSLKSVNFDIFDKGGSGDRYVTQGYGATQFAYRYIGDWHNGIDIAASYGAPIYSPTDGVVVAIGDQDDFCPRMAFGRFIAVEDDVNHVVLLFAHLANIPVKPLDVVKKGQLIGTVGASGDETGTHLHFSIFESGTFSMAPAHGCGPYPQGHDVNPLNYLGSAYQ